MKHFESVLGLVVSLWYKMSSSRYRVEASNSRQYHKKASIMHVLIFIQRQDICGFSHRRHNSRSDASCTLAIGWFLPHHIIYLFCLAMFQSFAFLEDAWLYSVFPVFFSLKMANVLSRYMIEIQGWYSDNWFPLSYARRQATKNVEITRS